VPPPTLAEDLTRQAGPLGAVLADDVFERIALLLPESMVVMDGEGIVAWVNDAY
jgi:hypothetical protein